MNRKEMWKQRKGCYVHLYNKTLVFENFKNFLRWDYKNEKQNLIEEIYRQ